MSLQRTDATDERAATVTRPVVSPGRKRLLVALTVLVFLAIGAVALYAISLIVGAVVLLLFSALLAYLIYPLVRFLQRRLPRALAITVAYVLVAGVLVAGMCIVTVSLIQQSSALAQSIQFLLSPDGERHLQALSDVLVKLGLPNDLLAQFEDHLLAQVQVGLAGVLPFLIAFFSNAINLIVVISFSVYFVLDGPGIIDWFRFQTPTAQRGTINFLLRVLDQSLGGYFRGSLLLAFIGALVTGVGLTLLHVPYAVLLGMLFFFLYFVPVIGGYVIEILCILAALPLGWEMMLIVAVCMTLFQGVVLGQILSPRVFSRHVGVHPIVALFALFAGGELFGVLGGFFSVPIAGVLQQIIVALWHRWKDEHPERFSSQEMPLQQSAVVPDK